MKDLKSNIRVVQSLVPVSRTAAGDGSGVDLQGFGSVCVAFNAGAIGGTATPKFTFEIQESDDNSAFTAVADADLQGAEPVIVAANANTVAVVGYVGAKRYIRAALKTVAGTTPTLDCGASVILANPALLPTT